MQLAQALAAAKLDEAAKPAPVGIGGLMDLLKQTLRLPRRDGEGPLYYAIDHCFPLKGQGTVLTGTVLSGALKVGQEVHFDKLEPFYLMMHDAVISVVLASWHVTSVGYRWNSPS